MLRPLGFAVGLVLVLTACGTADDDAEPQAAPEEDETTAEPEEPEETDGSAEEETHEEECEEFDDITIAFFSTLKVGFMPTVIARELGFFEDFCINATLEQVGTGLNTLQAVQAGEAHVGIPGTPSIINAVSAGSPVRAIWSPAAVSTQAVVAVEGYESCEDLEGETIADDGPGGQAYHVMEMFLETCGLNIASDVEHFIGTPGDFAAVMAGGTAQAAPQHADDVAVIEREFGIELNQLALVADFAADFAYQSTVVSQEDLEANPDLYTRIVAAMIMANRWLHPDAGNRDEATRIGEELSGAEWGDPERGAEVFEIGYDAYAENFPTTCDEAYPESAIEFTINLQAELGNLEEDVTFEDVIDMDICRAGEALADEHG